MSDHPPIHEFERRVINALEMARGGVVAGERHKQWIVDQLVRALCGNLFDPFVGSFLVNDEYFGWIAKYRAGEDRPDTYFWDDGLVP